MRFSGVVPAKTPVAQPRPDRVDDGVGRPDGLAGDHERPSGADGRQLPL